MSSKHSEFEIAQESVPWWTSCRLTISLVGLLGTISSYSMRAIMSVAIVCMTTDNETSSDENGNYSVHNQFAEMSWKFNSDNYDGSAQGEFTWDRELRGWVLSSFYFGYILTQVPGGWLANKFGGKMIIEAAVGSLAVLSLLTPITARASVYLLMVLQALKGAAAGVYYPAFYQILGKWAPPNERSKLAVILSSGSAVGTVLSSILAGVLCEHGFNGGWPSIFYVFGIFGAVWSLLWLVIGFSSPSEHPRISEAELKYLKSSIKNVSDNQSLHIPWKALLTSVPVYVIFVTDVCYSWVWFVALSCLPQFMKDVLDLDITQNGLYSSMPYITNFCLSIAGSVLADFLIARKVFSTTTVRKLLQSIGLVPCALVSLGVAFLPKDATALAIFLLAFWVGFLGFTRSGSAINMIELAPRYVGVILGIDYALCTIPGIIAPPIVGAMTPNGSKAEWQKVFYSCSAIATFGWLFYIICGDAKLQKWAKVEDDENNSDQEMNSERTSRWGMNSKDIARQRSLDASSEKSRDNQAFKCDTEDLKIYSPNRERIIIKSIRL